MIQCLECLKSYKQLQMHIKTHGLTSSSYIEKYPNAKIISDDTLKIYSKLNSGKNNPRYGKLVTNYTRNKIQSKKNQRDILNKKWKETEAICVICKSKFKTYINNVTNLYKKKTCSKICTGKYSASFPRIWTKEKRILASEHTKELWQDTTYANNIIQKTSTKFSSKNEREIVKYFKEHFNNDEWKSGGVIYHTGLGISRDLYSDKLKVCIEYDGIWHFKNIHNQLKYKQMKDSLLEDWCIQNNYYLIRISEDVFNSNKEKWLKILCNTSHILHSLGKVIKFY